MFVLLGFSAFVVDYGVLWLSREQAQNAADAGAMAGAIARAYDDSPDSPGGIVEQSATQVAAANPVWFESPAPVVVHRVPCWRDRSSVRQSRSLSRWHVRELGVPTIFGQCARHHVSGSQGDGHGAGGCRQQHELSEAVGDSRQVDRAHPVDWSLAGLVGVRGV